MDADKVARFLAATERAIVYMVNHPEASWEIFAGSSAELDDALNERAWADRSEEHTSELQSLMRHSYAVFCLKKKTNNITKHDKTDETQPQHQGKHSSNRTESNFYK